MASPLVINIILMLCSVLVLSSTFCVAFKVDLVHRDSPLSPIHVPTNKTQFEQVLDAARRSISRANMFTTDGGAESTVRLGNGEYIMSISLGTPPVEIHAVVDTGSDLIWTQCTPCDNCYKQVDPLFSSRQSSTYRNLACESTACTSLGHTGCDIAQQCTYSYSYNDKSYTEGSLATDTIRVGPVPIFQARFGCGRNNGGTFDGAESGIVGLGGGPFSLVRQLGALAGGKFSYCLVSPTAQSSSTSSIFFGPDAIVSGNGVVSTPLVRKDGTDDTFYYLTLEGISVGGNRVAYKSSKTTTVVEEGNMVIDSGTTLTVLPTEFFSEFVWEVTSAIGVEPTEDPSGVFNLCYDVSGGRGGDIYFPAITAHFYNGADVVLESTNSFVLVQDGLVCMTLVDRADDVGIFGNLSQRDYLIGYDLEEGTVSFKPTDCALA